MRYDAEDARYIRADNIEEFCNTNEVLLTSAPRGIVLEFPGLGGGSCLGGDMELHPYVGPHAQRLADAGLLLAYTFPGPWSWMNKGAVRMTDLLVDAIREKYGLGADSPLGVSGGSMGGQGALMYACRSRHRVTACAAACPCFDVPAAVSVRPEFPRTFLRAVADYDMPFGEALLTLSPRHCVDELPSIPYFITCDCADELFPEAGMDEFVAAMRARGLSVSYRKMPGMGHGGFTPEVREELTTFLVENT